MDESDKTEFPATIFKYRTFVDPFHKNLLKKRELYFPRTNQVNDPFDCKIPIQLKNFSGIQFIQDAMELARKCFPEKSIDEYYQMAIDAVNIDLINNEEHMKVERETEKEFYQRNFGVLCLSSSWKNILLWSHYADCHRGFCVELNIAGLNSASKLLTSGWVKYRNEFPIWDIAVREPTLNTVDYIFTKFKEWNYEEEFRLVSIQHIGAVAPLNPECFVSLTLGVEVSRRDQAWAIENFKKIDENLPIYKATLSSTKHFTVDRDLIA